MVINEFQADNEDGPTDEAGQKEDWLELYNNTAAPVSLTGLYLTDNPENPAKWAFPEGTSIPGNGFLIVWLDEDQLDGSYHANFKLSAAGEFIMLSDGAGTVLDSLTFGPQLPTASYGRYPNGTGAFNFLPLNFNAFNSLVSTQAPDRSMLQLMPNPASETFTLQSDAPLGRVQVLDHLGRTVQEIETNQLQASFPVASLPVGMYAIRVGSSVLKVMVVK